MLFFFNDIPGIIQDGHAHIPGIPLTPLPPPCVHTTAVWMRTHCSTVVQRPSRKYLPFVAMPRPPATARSITLFGYLSSPEKLVRAVFGCSFSSIERTWPLFFGVGTFHSSFSSKPWGGAYERGFHVGSQREFH